MLKPTAKKTQIFAHRGFSGKYPENSPLAFRKTAEETGAGGIESDVHISKDGQLVIIHDNTVDRTSNGTGYVKDLTYEELLSLDIGSWKSPDFAGEHIWTLPQLLDFCRESGLLLNLELKNDEIFYSELEERAIAEIQARKMEDRVFVSSFNHVSMERFKVLCPDIKTGLLYGAPMLAMRRYLARSNTDNIHPRYSVLQFDPELMDLFRDCGLKVNTWTVNREEDMRDMLDLGVDCIITNHPDVLCRVAAEHIPSDNRPEGPVFPGEIPFSSCKSPEGGV